MESKKYCDNNIRISVIATFYNCKPYIHRCVKSIQEQSFSAFELILVDDGSDDGSEEIFRELAQQEKITVLHSGHQGVSVARNMGIEAANGDYIMFVDGDDYISDIMLEHMVSQLKDEDVICCSCECFQEEKATQIQSHFYNGDLVFETPEEKINFYSQLIDGAFMQVGTPYTAIGVPWGKLYRRKFLLDHHLSFYPELKRMQDNIFNMEVAFYANKLRYIDQPLYCYRLNNIVQFNKKPYSPVIYQAVLRHRQSIMEELIKPNDPSFIQLFMKEKVKYHWLSVKHIAMSVEYPEFCRQADELSNQAEFQLQYHGAVVPVKLSKKYRVFRFLAKNRMYALLYRMCRK